MNEEWQLGMSVLTPGHVNWDGYVIEMLFDGIARPPLSTTVVGSHNPKTLCERVWEESIFHFYWLTTEWYLMICGRGFS